MAAARAAAIHRNLELQSPSYCLPRNSPNSKPPTANNAAVPRQVKERHLAFGRPTTNGREDQFPEACRRQHILYWREALARVLLPHTTKGAGVVANAE